MSAKISKKSKKIHKLPRLFFQGQAYDFVRNLSDLLSAGLTVSSALDSCLEEITSGPMKRVVDGIRKDILEGETLSSSLFARRVLPVHVIAFIKMGEESGKLVENLKILVRQNDKEIVFKSKINSTLLYSAIIIFLTITVGIGIAWYVLPRVADVYSQFNAKLPPLTIGLVILGNIMAKYGYILVPVILSFIVIIFYFLFSFPKTRFVGDLIIFKLPLVKRLIREVEISRMGFSLSSMLNAGLPLSESLRSLPYTTTFNNYKKFYLHLSKRIEEGYTFQESISLYPSVNKIIPTSVRQMIVAAEKSGTLSNTFLRIGEIFELRVEGTARNLPIILEPILLTIVGAAVALFVLGTMLPIYNLFKVIS